MELKQVFLVREDLGMSPGKTAVQVAHAAVQCVMKSDVMLVRDWATYGAKKVVLKVKNEAELHNYENAARSANLKSSMVQDAGDTEVEAGTETVLGIGPATAEKIDQILSDLQTY